MNKGKQRYSQSHDTPFCQEPLASLIGTNKFNQQTIDQILQGNFNIPEQLDQNTKDFIHQLTFPENYSDQIKSFISTVQYIACWEKMKETTQASECGLSFGELITGIKDYQVAEFDAA